MNIDYNKLYDKDFYGKLSAGMSRSAVIILGYIYSIYNPKSVIDIGCGHGAWLSAAESFGATTLRGFDGNWVKAEDLFSNNIDFVPVNLSDSLPIVNEKYDICISLEVAEHLPEGQAESFVDMLCQSSDTILFGAAIKYQGGTNHINEQWQTYWIKLFRSRGYECIDCIRGAIWNNTSVEWWYKQNTFLFIGPNNTNISANELKELEEPIFDVAHPINYENKVQNYQNTINYYHSYYQNMINYPTLRFCALCIQRWFNIKIRRIIGSDV